MLHVITSFACLMPCYTILQIYLYMHVFLREVTAWCSKRWYLQNLVIDGILLQHKYILGKYTSIFSASTHYILPFIPYLWDMNYVPSSCWSLSWLQFLYVSICRSGSKLGDYAFKLYYIIVIMMLILFYKWGVVVYSGSIFYLNAIFLL
jgi:hypothetical protein